MSVFLEDQICHEEGAGHYNAMVFHHQLDMQSRLYDVRQKLASFVLTSQSAVSATVTRKICIFPGQSIHCRLSIDKSVSRWTLDYRYHRSKFRLGAPAHTENPRLWVIFRIICNFILDIIAFLMGRLQEASEMVYILLS